VVQRERAILHSSAWWWEWLQRCAAWKGCQDWWRQCKTLVENR